jgi:acyl-coenzyme A thioesterase PaaI-like protein
VTQVGVETFGVSEAGGRAYGELIAQLRGVIGAATVTNAAESDIAAAATHLRRASDLLAVRVADGQLFPAGHRVDLPARGHPLLIPLQVDSLTEDAMHGRVRFTSAYVGHPGVAHGGFIALVFDEAFGIFPSRLDPPARTVSMAITYRAGTPADVDLDIDVRLVSMDERKVRVEGQLRHGGTVTAQAEGLFVQPRRDSGHRLA